MKKRIALSLVLGLLMVDSTAFADDLAPPAPPGDNGIGTSPSYDLMCVAAPAPCGIWVDVDEATADARARVGAPPDMVVFTAGHTSCSDAIAAAETLWPSAAVVFEVEQGWRAKVAASHPPAVAPAMMEWRAPAPRTARAPLQAAFPLLAVLAIVVPLVQTVIGKIFATQVKDANRRTEIAGYVDTAFHLVEQLGPQLGLTGAEKYNRFIEQVIDGLKAAGSPELSGKEMAELQRKAAVKAMLAKTRAVLPARPPMPLPPPPRG